MEAINLAFAPCCVKGSTVKIDALLPSPLPPRLPPSTVTPSPPPPLPPCCPLLLRCNCGNDCGTALGAAATAAAVSSSSVVMFITSNGPTTMEEEEEEEKEEEEEEKEEKGHPLSAFQSKFQCCKEDANLIQSGRQDDQTQWCH
jgi:hypothetical protein